jgi:hypothetical protein
MVAFENIPPKKPLNGKAYGSIGHLPQSRVGPGDWHVHEGQARIFLERPRKGDRVIVSEKLDGCAVAVANVDGELIPLTRSGYRTSDVTFKHLQLFGHWVERNSAPFDRLLEPGERVCGEWLAMAHGTIYDPDHKGFAPFIAFDLFRDGKRVLADEFRNRVEAAGLKIAHVIHDGPNAVSIDAALDALGPAGFHGSIDPVEGAVWRVEREGRVDFLAKFVRHDKVDGKYFEQITGAPPRWIVSPALVFAGQ